jgi:hypothetical protein
MQPRDAPATALSLAGVANSVCSDVTDEFFELPAAASFNGQNLDNSDLKGRRQIGVDLRCDSALLGVGQRFFGGETGFQTVKGCLPVLLLADMSDPADGLASEGRPEGPPIREAHDVTLPPHHARKGGQAPTAGTGRRDLGKIADIIAKQRRCEVMERRDDDAPDVSGFAHFAVFAQNLDDDGFALAMQPPGRRTLYGDHPDFFCRVGFVDLDAETLSHGFADLWTDSLANG